MFIKNGAVDKSDKTDKADKTVCGLYAIRFRKTDNTNCVKN